MGCLSDETSYDVLVEGGNGSGDWVDFLKRMLKVWGLYEWLYFSVRVFLSVRIWRTEGRLDGIKERNSDLS